MRMIKLNCPNCNAGLEAEENLDVFYCKYCGTKIIMSGMSKEAYKSRVRMKQMEHDERMKDKDHEQERYRYEYAAREKNKERKFGFWNENIPMLFFLILIVGGGTALFSFERKMDKVDATLQQVEAEVEKSIQESDFDTALLKANQLRYDKSYSSEEAKLWDEKRENYIQIISDKQRSKDLKDPDNIFVSADYKSFQGRNLDEVKSEFEKMGFTNISAQPASKKAGWLDKAESVEHILIGGKSEFTEEDYFNKDTSIIIYYYEK